MAKLQMPKDHLIPIRFSADEIKELIDIPAKKLSDKNHIHIDRSKYIRYALELTKEFLEKEK